MKVKNLYILLLGLLSIAVLSCEEDTNQWDVDSSHSRLFRSTDFQEVALQSTSIQVKYYGVKDATKYVFELSEGDSLKFNNIVRTVEISVDTLAPYSEASTIVETEYRTWFADLKGTTKYSLRMKAVDEVSGVESGYSQLYFETPDEQIFKVTWPSLNKVTFTWTPGVAVTGILYWETAGSQESAVSYVLSEDEITAGQATIIDLSYDTDYSAQILNDDAVRGRTTFSTLGIREDVGITVPVNPGDDAGILITNAVESGHPVVALAFAGNQVYDFTDMTITIPDYVGSVHLIGDVAYGEEKPVLNLARINQTAPYDLLHFENVVVDAGLSSKNYVFDISTTNCFKAIEFEGCTIKNVGRSVVRSNAAELFIDRIYVNNCLIQSVGLSGYGFINMGKEDGGIASISITNSTITEFGSDRIMDLRAGVGEVILDKVTLCNYTSASKHLINFRSAPGRTSVTNCIFAGTNNGAEIASVGNATQAGYVVFDDRNYVTSDLKVSSTIPFGTATILSQTSTELFTDPQNGDFHIKPGVKFAGAGKAGDPKWW